MTRMDRVSPHAQADSLALVGDVGGTNVRLGLALDYAGETASITALRRYRCADYDSLQDVIAQYGQDTGLKSLPAAVSLAVASPVVNDRATLTNRGWSFDSDGLRGAFGFETINFINDFAAIGLALPFLTQADFLTLDGPDLAPDLWTRDQFRVAALGPGTGLGLTVLAHDRGVSLPLDTEGGHTAFAPATPLEMDILQRLMARYGRVSNERLLSGPGMVNFYEALAEIEGAKADALTPLEVTQRAFSGEDARAVRALDCFCAALGGYAGDVALATGSKDGVFMVGGVSAVIADYLQHSEFRSRFEAKGRFETYMKAIPTEAVVRDHAGLTGALISLNPALAAIRHDD